ncbi:unnamed protein product, partial [Rotaria sp. Silwood1]
MKPRSKKCTSDSDSGPSMAYIKVSSKQRKALEPVHPLEFYEALNIRKKGPFMYMLTRQGARRLIETEFHRLATIDITFPDHTPINPIVSNTANLIMAEKTVATLLSKALEQTPKFSGKPDQDADEWMKNLTDTFRVADMTEAQALQIIPTFLEGHPKQWFTDNRTIFESWNIFKAQFIHTYSSTSSKQLASNRLRTRQQRHDEAVIEYYTDVMKLCKLVDPTMT